MAVDFDTAMRVMREDQPDGSRIVQGRDP